MATSEIPAAVIAPMPCPVLQQAGVSAPIPTTGSAIAAEVLARHASIVEKFGRLKTSPPPVSLTCGYAESTVPKTTIFISHLRWLTDEASFNPSKVSEEGALSVEEIKQETPASDIIASFQPGITLE